jgi:hypothetical protein
VVIGNDKVQDGVQLEVAEAMTKRRPCKLPAAVTGGDWRLGRDGEE